MDREIREGNVVLCRDVWWAVMAALEGDESQRDDAFDALQRWTPRSWLQEWDDLEEHAREQVRDAAGQ